MATNINSGSTGEPPRVQPGPQQSSAQLKLKSAVRCAERGWHVIPLNWIEDGGCSCFAPGCASPGKHPLTIHGVKDASADTEVIRAWWEAHPNANLGIVTGLESGIVVLDIDPRHGGWESLRELEEKYGPLPQGPSVLTGGDGEHRYFLHPGVPVKNKAGLAAGIDIRADGGYVVGPRSDHISGQVYLWKPGQRPADLTIPAMPQWLLDQIGQAPPRQAPTTSNVINEGNRNATLASFAGSMRVRGMSPESIEAALLAENQAHCCPPLDDSEVRAISNSISKYATLQTDGVSAQPLGLRLGQKAFLKFQTGAEIAVATPAEVHWLAKPWIAAGAITEADGKVKLAGKTTWATHLVRSTLDGGVFMGESTTMTPVVYLTEQNPASFRETMRRAGLLGREDFIVLFWKDTMGLVWPVVVDAAVQECKRRGAKLLVVDTLAQFAGLMGDAENNAGAALAAMQPLQHAAAEGLGILMLRHERKSGGAVGDSGRGSSAFAGAVDIVLSIRRADGNQRNVRRIDAVSRFDETPAELLIELTEEGYRSVGAPADVAKDTAASVIVEAIPESKEDAVTIADIINTTGKSRTHVQRRLDNLLKDGKILRTGDGTKSDPFRYYVD